MTKEWHYAWQGQSHGPVSDESMQDLIRAGRVRSDTLIWSDGMTNWEPAAQHFGFASTASAATAPPPMPSGAPGTLYSGAPGRSFGEAIKVCFQKYVTFKGRASRSEYWWFMLFVWLLGLAGGVLEGAMGNDGAAISGLMSIATFLPSLAVQVRRLHDIDRSGWWVGGFYLALLVAMVVGFGAGVSMGPSNEPPAGFIGLMALTGIAFLAYIIVMIVFMVRRGDPGPNRFG